MALDPSIFRKSALERLQNPERLDHLMRVTTPRSWTVLTALAIVVGGVFLWGFVGTTPETVQVLGIMLREGGVFEVQARGSGQVETLLVEPGDMIEQGEVVAHIAQPQLRVELDHLEDQLAQLQGNRARVSGGLDQTTRIDLDAIAQQRQQAIADRSAVQAQLDYLEQRRDAEQEALDRGLITPDILQSTVSQIASTRDQLVNTDVTMRQLESRAITTRSSAADQVFAIDQQIASTESQIANAREQYRLAREVVSPFDGMVIEGLVDLGETVNSGTALFGLELEDRPLELMLFTPEGRRIDEGMEVQVVPSGVVAEEDGYLLGTVSSISDFPLSSQAMNRYLRNSTLVQQFEGATGAYLIEVEPKTDSSTPSGYEWTTDPGPDIRLGAGTLLSGNVVVEVNRPITMVIPALKEWLSGN